MGSADWEPGTHIADPGKEARSASGIPVVPVFDGYRALAIAGVVLLHLLGESGVLRTGDGGALARLIWGTVGHAVDILFVVSGFVVFLPTVTRQGEFGRVVPYAIRRAARLFPAYWLALALMLVLIAFVDGSPAMPSAASVLAHLTGLQAIAQMAFDGIPAGFGVDPPVWTLSAEVTFYILLPLFAGIYFRRPFAGLAVAALVTVLWGSLFENLGDAADAVGAGLSGPEAFRLSLESTLQFPSWAFSFGLGMTGAWVYARLWRSEDSARRRRIVGVTQVASLASLAFFAYLAGGYSDDAAIQLVAQASRLSPEIALGYSASLATLMVAIALGGERWQRPFANRPIRQLGDISYGIYLSHMVIVFYLGTLISMPRDGSAGGLAVWILAIVPASVAYGYLSARYLEQPVRRWARRFGRRETTRSAGPK